MESGVVASAVELKQYAFIHSYINLWLPVNKRSRSMENMKNKNVNIKQISVTFR